MEMNAHNDLTTGSLTRGLLRLTVPMIISAFLQNAQSLIDLYWVGSLGSESVAALALSGTVLMMMFPLVMGMAAGTVALVSRRVGEGDYTQASNVAGQAIGLAFLLGCIAGLSGYAATPALCRLLGAPPQIAVLATEYMRIVFLGSFTVFLLFIGGHSVFQAAGNTVIPMMTMILANLLNLVLDPILIFGMFGLPAMGIRGAALATVAAQAVAAALAVVLLGCGAAKIRVHLSHLLPKPAIALSILRIGIPGTGQMLARSLMALVLMRIVASCGATAMAAYGIGLRFHMIVLMPAFAFGNSAATLVGQNLGAGNPARAQRSAWLSVGMATVLIATAGLLLIGLAPLLIRIFDDNPEVVAIGTSFLRITSGFFVFATLAIVLGRALMGAGDTVMPMVCTIIALWGLQVPLALFLSRILEPATRGIWWAVAATLTAHGLLVAAWFQTGRWKTRKV